MLRLDFASRGFYFCAYCAAFALAVILPAAQCDFGEPKSYELARRRGFTFYEVRFCKLAARALFLRGVILSWLYGAVFKLRLYKPTARHGFVCYEFCILRICFCKTGFDFKP